LEPPALLAWFEDVELVVDDPPQPATMRAIAASESAAVRRRGKGIDQLLI
jgi:hypothetical protein